MNINYDFLQLGHIICRTMFLLHKGVVLIVLAELDECGHASTVRYVSVLQSEYD